MMKLNVEKVNLKVWVDLTGEVLNSQLTKAWQAKHSNDIFGNIFDDAW